MITLGLDMYIGNPMSWTHSLIKFKVGLDNLLCKHISHFDWIKDMCLVSYILSIKDMGLYLNYVH